MTGELSPLQSAALTHGIGADDLERAYKARRRSHWPPYEQSMLDPIYSRLVLIAALHGAIERYAVPEITVDVPADIEVREDSPPIEGAKVATWSATRRKDDGPHWWDNI